MLQPIRVESRVWKKIIISRSNVRYSENNITETMCDNDINDTTSVWIGIFLVWVAQIEAVTICSRCSQVVTTKKYIIHSELSVTHSYKSRDLLICPWKHHVKSCRNHVINVQITWFIAWAEVVDNRHRGSLMLYGGCTCACV